MSFLLQFWNFSEIYGWGFYVFFLMSKLLVDTTDQSEKRHSLKLILTQVIREFAPHLFFPSVKLILKKKEKSYMFVMCSIEGFGSCLDIELLKD